MARNECITECPPLPVVEGVEFRHVTGWIGYAASNDGHIWSCVNRWGYTSPWRRIKEYPNRLGYLYVRLFSNTIQKTGKRRLAKTVHSLICEAFHGPRPDGLDCCHNDNSRDNNAATNLRWDTVSSNISDAVRAGTMTYGHLSRFRGEQHHHAKYSNEVVAEIRRLRGRVHYKVLAARYGMHPAHVISIWNGRARKYG